MFSLFMILPTKLKQRVVSRTFLEGTTEGGHERITRASNDARTSGEARMKLSLAQHKVLAPPRTGAHGVNESFASAGAGRRACARRYGVMGSGVQGRCPREQERRVAFGYTGARFEVIEQRGGLTEFGGLSKAGKELRVHHEGTARCGRMCWGWTRKRRKHALLNTKNGKEVPNFLSYAGTRSWLPWRRTRSEHSCVLKGE